MSSNETTSTSSTSCSQSTQHFTSALSYDKEESLEEAGLGVSSTSASGGSPKKRFSFTQRLAEDNSLPFDDLAIADSPSLAQVLGHDHDTRRLRRKLNDSSPKDITTSPKPVAMAMDSVAASHSHTFHHSDTKQTSSCAAHEYKSAPGNERMLRTGATREFAREPLRLDFEFQESDCHSQKTSATVPLTKDSSSSSIVSSGHLQRGEWLGSMRMTTTAGSSTSAGKRKRAHAKRGGLQMEDEKMDDGSLLRDCSGHFEKTRASGSGVLPMSKSAISKATKVKSKAKAKRSKEKWKHRTKRRTVAKTTTTKGCKSRIDAVQRVDGDAKHATESESSARYYSSASASTDSRHATTGSNLMAMAMRRAAVASTKTTTGTLTYEASQKAAAETQQLQGVYSHSSSKMAPSFVPFEFDKHKHSSELTKTKMKKKLGLLEAGKRRRDVRGVYYEPMVGTGLVVDSASSEWRKGQRQADARQREHHSWQSAAVRKREGGHRHSHEGSGRTRHRRRGKSYDGGKGRVHEHVSDYSHKEKSGARSSDRWHANDSGKSRSKRTSKKSSKQKKTVTFQRAVERIPSMTTLPSSSSPSIGRCMDEFSVALPSLCSSSPSTSVWKVKAKGGKRRTALTLELLAADCHSVIVSFLAFSDVLALSRTCRYWNSPNGGALSFVSSLQPRVFHYEGISELQLNALLSRVGKRLRNVDLTYVASVVSDTHLCTLAQKCPFLKSLTLFNCSKISAQGFNDFVSGVSLVSSTRQGGGRFLTHLDVSGCSQLDSSSLACVAQHCGELKWLDCAWCSQIAAHSVATHLPRLCQNGLEYLNVFECNLFNSMYFAFDDAGLFPSDPLRDCRRADAQQLEKCRAKLWGSVYEATAWMQPDVALLKQKRLRGAATAVSPKTHLFPFSFMSSAVASLSPATDRSATNSNYFALTLSPSGALSRRKAAEVSRGSGKVKAKRFERKLYFVGGLDRNGTHPSEIDYQTNRLEQLGIFAAASGQRSICEKLWNLKCAALRQATELRADACTFDVRISKKIYTVFGTDKGAFGLKLAPDKDFPAERKQAQIKAIQKMNKEQFLKYIRNTVQTPQWPWTDGYQGVRGFVLIGMEQNSWIKYSVNAFHLKKRPRHVY